MKFFTKFLILFATLAIFSCSKKEDPLVGPVVPLSILLKSDAGSEDLEAVGVNAVVQFTVVGSDGEDYTDDSRFFVNDQEIPGSTFEFTQTGQFSVKAIYNEIASNILNFQVLEPTERALTIDVPKAMRDQTITFGLRDDQGNDMADDATFYVNEESISGKTFSSATPGVYKVYAVYEANNDTLTTPVKTFEIFIPKRKVAIEDYTGTWCGWCPEVAVAIKKIRDTTSQVAVVTIHKALSGIPDPLDFPRIGELQEMFDVDNGFPKARINRTVDWPRPYLVSQIMDMAGTNTDVSIAINSQLTGSNLSVNVKVVYENGSTPGDKLVVYLLENGVVAPQANYFDQTPGHLYYGQGNPIPNYIHDDGLRNSLSTLFGDPIPNKPAYEVHSKDYSFVVPSTYVGENLSFVVMVVDANNNAKNAQFSKINENKNYE